MRGSIMYRGTKMDAVQLAMADLASQEVAGDRPSLSAILALKAPDTPLPVAIKRIVNVRPSDDIETSATPLIRKYMHGLRAYSLTFSHADSTKACHEGPC